MGLYCIPIKRDKIEAIPRMMKSIGVPVIRTEERENGVYYFYKHPKQPTRERAFWITLEIEGRPPLLMAGISQLTDRILAALSAGGVFEHPEGDAWIEAVRGKEL